jgi:hypothetical protein
MTIRHLGLGYRGGNVAAVCRQWVEGFGDAEFRRAMADNGTRELRRLSYSQRGRADYETRARILVCTPTHGGVHPHHAKSLLELYMRLEVEAVHGFELLASWQWAGDIVRIRSRFLRAALETDCTHVFFLDSDVACRSDVVVGMVKTGHPIVCVPYPKREGLNWKALAIPGAEIPLKARAYRYSLGMKQGALVVDEHNCAPIEWGPLGCTLIARSAIERMVEYYRAPEHGLRFLDRVAGVDHPTVALFQLLIRDGLLLSEDRSFFQRAADIDIPIHVYFGEGSPADHYGDYAYEGHLGAFGLKRLPA